MINKKKRGFILITALMFVSLFLIANVSAQSPFESIAEGLGGLISTLIDALEPILKAVLGDVGGDDLFFTKVLLFIIVLSIVWVALEKVDLFSDYEFIHWILAIVVSILSVRFLTDESWIQTILLPYSTLGIVVTAFAPFIIWFAFVNIGLKEQPSIIRRFLWIAFAVVFVAIWSVRWTEFQNATTGFNASNIYFWIFGLSLLMAIFDGTISKAWHKIQLKKYGAKFNRTMITKLKADLATLNTAYTGSMMSHKNYQKQWDTIVKQITDLGGSM